MNKFTYDDEVFYLYDGVILKGTISDINICINKTRTKDIVKVTYKISPHGIQLLEEKAFGDVEKLLETLKLTIK